MARAWFTPEFPGFGPPDKPLPRADNGVVSWRRWKSKNHVACDQCLLDAASGLRQSALSGAAYVRVENRKRMFLCHDHARERREQDRI